MVGTEDLTVKNEAERVLSELSGGPCDELESGELCIGHELPAHILEFKTAYPFSDWKGLDRAFARSVEKVTRCLSARGLALLGGGVHPFMNPAKESRVWSRGDKDIYHKFHHLFDVSRHGWSNIQSTHLNISFSGDAEFHRLHSAIRLLLPIIPALAAASPVLDGKPGGHQDLRLVHYADNSIKMPELTGKIIPEPATSQGHYRELIYNPIQKAMAPHDPLGIMDPAWLNARGAIARFDRGSIEVRLCDAQENPVCDLAVMSALAAVVRGVEAGSQTDDRDKVSTESLSALLREIIRAGEYALVEDATYLSLLGLDERPRLAGDIWRELLKIYGQYLPQVSSEVSKALAVILDKGTLATRLLASLRRQGLELVWGALVESMTQATPFQGMNS